ncbi:MAG: nucleotide exchange factor GrpE [Gammaproteobacteria bacterium]|nr:nucleotide exchange factor GrpE [Gammaproteobacteria bacterium]
MSSKTTQAEETEDKYESMTVESAEPTEESPVPEAVSTDDISDVTKSDQTPEEELEQAQATVKDYWEQIMRLRAEMENDRKRAERNVENAHKYALKNFVEALLPVIDSMEMGLNAAVAENATLDSIRQGSELTLNMFIQVLEKQGLHQIDPLGEKFDPEQHQAISMIEDDAAESNSVINVMQKGFSLNDRLVRPAMVVVAK